ncbi:MAG: ATP-binding protein [Nitrososphaeria archaeon]
MSEELATLLSGRDVEVFPLSFREFLEFKGLEIRNATDAIIMKFEVIQKLREYLEFGGFPEVVLEDNEEKKKVILRRYFETILVKDAERRFKVREKEKLEFLANFYITNISSLITFTGVSKVLGIPKKTVERFSSHLATSRALFFVQKFSLTLKEQERAARKVYSIDTGMSNTVGFKIFEGYGKTMENVVTIELLRRLSTSPTAKIYYTKVNDKEVDFVIREGLEVKQLIQVSYVYSKDEISKREIYALEKASEELKCNNLVIVTWDVEGDIEVNGKMVALVPLWKWLLVYT